MLRAEGPGVFARAGNGGLITPWYNDYMPAFPVETPVRRYQAIVERGVISRIASYIPPKTGNLFVVTTEDVWNFHGHTLQQGLASRSFHTLFFTGGEDHKRMAEVERLAEEMVAAGADRSSLVIAFGGGIVNDLGGFLAAIFMRGIPVIQVPTTLLAQVDAAVGGKTGANLLSGKNLIGAFHQPLAVLIDPDVLGSLPEREYRAGLYEIVKCGIIRSRPLFDLLDTQSGPILAQRKELLDQIIAESVRIKAEVVTADEKEGDLRRILNYGHTVGHALEAETQYVRFLHGEAVAFGMKAATHLSHSTGLLSAPERDRILACIRRYGPIPSLSGIAPASLVARLGSDKKTIQGKVHFVLTGAIGSTQIVSGIPESQILAATEAAFE